MPEANASEQITEAPTTTEIVDYLTRQAKRDDEATQAILDTLKGLRDATVALSEEVAALKRRVASLEKRQANPEMSGEAGK